MTIEDIINKYTELMKSHDRAAESLYSELKAAKKLIESKVDVSGLGVISQLEVLRVEYLNQRSKANIYGGICSDLDPSNLITYN